MRINNKCFEIPVLHGLCKDDGMILSAQFFRSQNRWNLLRQNWTDWASLIFLGRDRDLISENDRAVAREIGKFYFGEEVLFN